MLAKQLFLGLVNPGREIRRSPLVGMKFLHQRSVGARDVAFARPSLQAKELIGILIRHFAAARRSPPRCRVTLCVFSSVGIPAVLIRHQ